MAEVIPHDFGKADREHVRRFLRLLGILEDHEAAVLADPIKYLNEAGKQIAELRAQIFAAWEVLALTQMTTVRYGYDEPLAPIRIETITVRKDEYLALREVYDRVTKLAGMRCHK